MKVQRCKGSKVQSCRGAEFKRGRRVEIAAACEAGLAMTKGALRQAL